MKKAVVLTGATGSVGKATAIELAKNDCQLILLGRNPEKLAAVKAEITKVTGNSSVDIYVADLGEPKSIQLAAAEISKKYNSLNALLNIAAIYRSGWHGNSQQLESMFATNHLGPFVLTNALLPILKSGAPSRIVTVSAPSTSKINLEHLKGKENFTGSYLSAFGASKMMNLMFTYSLARRLEGTGVSASVLHPGLVKSDLTIEMPGGLKFLFKLMAGKPDKAAKMLCDLAIDKKYEKSNGCFYKSNGKEIKSNAYSYDQELQEKLWKVSEVFAGNN